VRKTLRTQSGALPGRAGARPARVRPPTLLNYSADAGAGSNTIMVMGDHTGWRAALLGTVAAGALLFYSARSARAQIVPPAAPCDDVAGTTVTCSGNLQPGIETGDPYDTLIVDNVTANIAPAVNVDGINFVRAGAGDTITIISDTEPFDIVTTGTGDGIYARADGTIIIDHAGDIDAGDNGIFARNDGSGAIDIVASGAVEGTSRNGISAFNTDNSTEGISITTYAAVTGGDSGIEARNFGSGAIEITINGDVGRPDGPDPLVPDTGIYAANGGGPVSAGTDITVTTGAGTRVTGETYGIRVMNYGSGDTEIVAEGVVEAINPDGRAVVGYNSIDGTGDVNIQSGATVTGGRNGIWARNFGEGGIDVVASGHVEAIYGIYGRGLEASTFISSTGDIAIETASVTGGQYGIRAFHQGTGAVSIIANGAVEGITAAGIYAYNSGNSDYGISIDSAAVTGGDFGIRAFNYGDGAIEIITNGDVGRPGLIPGTGIFAQNGAVGTPAGTDIAVTTAAGTTVTGGDYGIYIKNYGYGTVTVTANSRVESTVDAAIFAQNSFAGSNLTVTTAAVSGGSHGIFAQSFGDGALSITTNGDVAGAIGMLANNYGDGALSIVVNADVDGTTNGIEARNGSNFVPTGTNLTVTSAAGTTITGGTGIIASSFGDGALTINVAGDVSSALGMSSFGIDARHSAYGTNDLSVTVRNGSTVSGDAGIFAENAGSGALNVTINGAIEGANGVGLFASNTSAVAGGLTVTTGIGSSIQSGFNGIYARDYSQEGITITVGGDITADTGVGILAMQNSGQSIDITISETATVTSTTVTILTLNGPAQRCTPPPPSTAMSLPGPAAMASCWRARAKRVSMSP